MSKQNVTFLSLSMEWLQLKKIYVKYSTYIKYENTIHIHLIPYFFSYSIDNIDESIIIKFFSKKIEEHFSYSSIKIMRYTLKSILQLAEDKYNYQHIHFESIKLPKSQNKCYVLTSYEKQLIEKYCFFHYDSISISILLGLYAGLRIGEICALQWKDIDLKTGIIHISKTVQRLKNKNVSETKTSLIITDPKTPTSKRKVPIPFFFKEYLIEYYHQIDDCQDTFYVISHNKKIIDPRTIQYQFKKICYQYHIDINFHALRHTYATNCIMLGIDVKSLSEILGHSNISTTLNLYVHSSMEFKINQINKIIAPQFS